MRNFVITLVLGAIIGFGCAKAMDQSAVAESSVVLPDLIKPGARIGLAYINVEEGIDQDAFENYLKTDYLAKWNEAYSKTGTGTKGFLMKGVQGANEGKYGWFVIFPDDESYNQMFSNQAPGETLSRYMEEVGLTSPGPQFAGISSQTHLGDAIILPFE